MMDSAQRDAEDQARRLLWRCRRGLLELDIMLGRFIRHHYRQLDALQLQALDQLLDMPDNQFLDLLLEREQSALPHVTALLQLIRSSQDA